MRGFKYVLLLLLVCNAYLLRAQTCPDNIDFSKGDFTNWSCSTGLIDATGTITFNGYIPVNGRQTLVNNTSVALDPYGKFPVVAPNGSKYTLTLGNSGNGKQAEQVSYTYVIPSNKPDYVITYYYAVVLQLTQDHKDFERPRFAVKLTDLTNNDVINCGTHDFISGDGLGDFKKSDVGNIEYRDWSTVAVSLAGRQGHTVKFDFTTNDCTRGQHFGYAYLAFDDACTANNSLVLGGNICRGTNSITLSAPPGFGSYSWHLDGSTAILGVNQQLIVPVRPLDGTKYVVDVVSSSGVGAGCSSTFNTIIQSIDVNFLLSVHNPAPACESDGIDITNANVTAGSTGDGMHYKYLEADQITVVRDPTHITKSGTYFIQGTNMYGCSDVKFVDLILSPIPVVTPTNPKPVCSPATIDLTSADIVGSINPALTYEYYQDAALTVREPNPTKIASTGTYFIKVTNRLGCSTKVAVTLVVNDLPVVNVRSVTGCAPFDLSLADKSGDTPGITYQYFTDAKATAPVNAPQKITETTTFYVVGTNAAGCNNATPSALTVTINPPAIITIIQPAPTVVFPATIDLSRTYTTLPGYAYNYYTDSALTTPLLNYREVANTAKYYIQATNSTTCTTTGVVTATINPPDNAGLDAKSAFTPNGDNINDEFAPKLVGAPKVNYLKIYSRNGSLVFETKDIDIHWKGSMNGSPVPVGTYYWVFSCYDTFYKQDVVKSGPVTVIR